jgi:G3E family GTPase
VLQDVDGIHRLFAQGFGEPARKGRFDYLLVESTGISEPLPGAEPRLGRRTVRTFPLLPPPQKN